MSHMKELAGWGWGIFFVCLLLWLLFREASGDVFFRPLRRASQVGTLLSNLVKAVSAQSWALSEAPSSSRQKL